MQNTNEEVVYAYYTRSLLKEHMLYLTEIAEMYNIKSINNKYHSRLVGVIIDAYLKAHPGIVYTKYYYPTKSGLARVYQEYIYRPAIIWFANILSGKGPDIEEALIGDLVYKFKWDYNAVLQDVC